ncbi:MAG TPA: DinB family protein [Longimicrobiales bacterium]
MSATTEAWLSGPIEGVDPYLMPVAHALVQAGRDLEHATAELTTAQLWARPGGAASIGFHLMHIAGVLDRLLTYARGEALSEAQFEALRAEGRPGEPPRDAAALLGDVRAAIDRALDQVRGTPRDTLLEPRAVGRKQLPSTVLGLLYHAAEHATRHTGQAITTAKVVRGSTESTTSGG